MADTNQKPEKTTSLRRRKLLIGVNILVQVVVIGALLGMVNWLVSRHYLRFDWTQAGYYKISDKTKQVLQGLPAPVQVVVFLQPRSEDNPQMPKMYQDVRDLLKEMQLFGRDKLPVEYVDPHLDVHRAKTLAEKYKVDLRENIVIFASGEHHKFVPLDEMFELDYSQMGMGTRVKAFKGESAFLTAMQSVTQGKSPKVYFLTGHGERSPENTDNRGGYSLVAQYAKRDNLEIARWSLQENQGLPTDAGVMVIAGPAKRFAPAELALLDDYMNKGGRLMVMLDPGRDTGLDQWLQKWSVLVENTFALARGSLLGAEMLTANAPGTDYSPHPITKKMEDVDTVFPYARTVRRAEAAGEGMVTPPPNVTELVRTPAAFWGETDLETQRPKFNEGVEAKGPLTLAVAVEPSRPPGVELDAGQYRMVVVGTSEFVANGAITQGNVDFFLNALNWLLKREALVAVGPKLPQEFRLNMSEKQVRITKWLVVAGMPLAVALAGLAVWARRRK